MHKLTKTFLHLWISLVSMAAFALGWAFVAHAQKPTPLVAPQAQQAQVVVSTQAALEPVPALDDFLNNDALQSQSMPAPNIVLPRLRSGGS
jgi:hypothetical protein